MKVVVDKSGDVNEKFLPPLFLYQSVIKGYNISYSNVGSHFLNLNENNSSRTSLL
jgi:hypothetical protein